MQSNLLLLLTVLAGAVMAAPVVVPKDSSSVVNSRFIIYNDGNIARDIKTKEKWRERCNQHTFHHLRRL